MNPKLFKAALLTLVACACVSIAISYSTYQYRINQPAEPNGTLSLWELSDTYLTPYSVFNPAVNSTPAPGLYSGVEMDGTALAKNIAVLFIPAFLIVLLVMNLWATKARRPMLTGAVVSGIICFALGSLLMYLYLLTPLKVQQQYGLDGYNAVVRLHNQISPK
ncbi:MAG: hypothetical protein WCO52_04160 [bacterium]